MSRPPIPTALHHGKARGLAPPFLASPDLDYRKAFVALAKLECEIQVEGLTDERLLRRCYGRFCVGNYLAATFDAERALRSDPRSTEAQFLKGASMLALAAVKHGVASPGIGPMVPARGLPRRRYLLRTARECFLIVLAANPEDQQARRGLAAADALLRDVGRMHLP